MSFVTWVDGHRRSILFLLALLILAGIASSFQLPVTLFPQAQFPRIVVSLDAGDRPAKQMELQVTRPAELALRAVLGVRSLRSKTSRGDTEISVNFDWGQDMISALLQVQAALNQVLPQFPPGTSAQAERRDPNVFPVVAYSLTSKGLTPEGQSLVDLRDLAEYQLVPLLSSVEGVARVGIQGGKEAEIRVDVDPAQLNAFGLTLNDVAMALSASNVLTALGRIEDHYKLYLEVSDTRFHGLEQIQSTVLRSGQNGQVLLEDVATVRMDTVPIWQRITADGQDAVLVEVYQKPAASVIRLNHDIAAVLNEYASQIPTDARINQWYDQSELVKSSEAGVRDSILFGIALAALVLLAFLRNLKLTLITIIAVPSVLATTMLMLYVLGLSLNIMTLGGMAAAIGLIIDDVIVMIEQIIRRVHQSGEHDSARVLSAAREFTQPLVGSSASTIIIFLPLAFLTGVTGTFFKALSLTMACALFISFLISWLVVPLLADHLLNEKDIHEGRESRSARRIRRGYTHLMVRTLRQPLWLLAGLIPLLGAGFLAWQQVGSGFIPTIDEGGFIFDYWSAPGTSLTETDHLLQQISKILLDTPEVLTYSRRTGAQLGGGLTEANSGDFFVRLKPGSERSRDTEEVMAEVREKVIANVPGLDIELFQLIEDEIGDLVEVPQPIEIKLYGDNEAEIRQVAVKVAEAIQSIPGVVDINNGVVLAGDSLIIDVDRAKAALEGLDPDAVTQQLSAYLSGLVTTQIEQDIKFVGVRVWVPERLRQTIDQIGAFRVRAPDGHDLPVSRIADISTVSGQPQITRDNLKPMVPVTARIENRSLGDAVHDVKGVLAQDGLIPKTIYWQLGGLYQQQQIAFRGLMIVFAAAVALVYFLLLFLYQSFTIAAIIMLAPLFSISAVFIGLWVTDIELNITAMMGMTMIIGIVTEIAIFYFSELTLQDSRRPLAQRLIRTGINRMRPITMTTFAAILALLPLALALGEGSAMQQPLAVAIISGLVVQMPLVLITIPVIYHLVSHKGKDNEAT